MRCKLFAAVFLVCSFHCLAQNLEVLNPPPPAATGIGSDLFTTLLPNATHLNGIAVFLNWGDIELKNATAPCTEATCNWNAIDPILLQYVNGINGVNGHRGLSYYGAKLNLIVTIIPQSGGSPYNNNVPTYVFKPGTYGTWCPGCAAQDQVTCNEWPGSNIPRSHPAPAAKNYL